MTRRAEAPGGIAAIVLAAGASRRMGRPKPLLPWRDTILLQHELAVLEGAGIHRVVVVLGARAQDVRRVVGADPRLVFNARWGTGRATSLARGAHALRAALRGAPPEAILVQNVDQPTTAEVIDCLLEAWRSSGAEAVQPVYRDAAGEEHGGHPVLLSGDLLPALLDVSDATEGLRGVLDGRRVERVGIDDPTVALDLDTPEAYEAARAALGA